MKLIVNSLIDSIRGILNVIVIIFFVWSIFAIFYMTFLQNKSWYCDGSGVNFYWGTTKENCPSFNNGNTRWRKHDINFDNYLSSMISLFVTATLEGWPDYMFQLTDATVIGPVRDYNVWVFWLFFIFIMIGSIVCMNLFTAIIAACTT